jgi:DNA-binding CsgD family transcriptional regulator
VTLNDRRADEMLGEALARIAVNDHSGVQSFPVRDGVTGALMVGHVLPIRLSARDIFARSAAVFVLMPVAAPSSPPVELVMSLFDLTPAEARVARGLAAGKTVDDLAGDNGVSPNTVRVQAAPGRRRRSSRRDIRRSRCGAAQELARSGRSE